MLPVILLAAGGAAAIMHLDHKIDNTRQEVIVLRSQENETRKIVNTHSDRLDTLEGVVPAPMKY